MHCVIKKNQNLFESKKQARGLLINLGIKTHLSHIPLQSSILWSIKWMKQ